MERLLRQLVERGGSDLHLRCGDAPLVRKDGSLLRLDEPPPDDTAIAAMIPAIMPVRNRDEFAATNDTDYAYDIDGVARFRGNAFRERKGSGAVFRVIPSGIPTAEQLGLPPCVQRLCQLTKGLVPVTGPTGSGKSTTLAAMIDLVNRTRSEPSSPSTTRSSSCTPIGAAWSRSGTSACTPRRSTPHCGPRCARTRTSCWSASCATSRPWPSRSRRRRPGTSSSAPCTRPPRRERWTASSDSFPRTGRSRSASPSRTLHAVVSQTLCRRIGGGRVAAQEILLSIPAVSKLIREGKMLQLPSVMRTSKRIGMQTLNDALLDLVDRRQAEPLAAYAKSAEKGALATALRARGHDVGLVETEAPRAATR